MKTQTVLDKGYTLESISDAHTTHGFAIVGYLGIDELSDSIKKGFVSANTSCDDYDNATNLLLSEVENPQKLKQIFHSKMIYDYRFQENIPNFDELDLESVILLPGKYYSFKKIQDFIQRMVFHNKNAIDIIKIANTLIIGDIPDNEISKYFNVFEENTIEIERVILISQSIRIAVFENIKGPYDINQLRFSNELTNSYINERDPRVEDAAHALYRYCEILRLYDTFLIWKRISDEQNNCDKVIFANQSIDWNGRNLDGYLDFSQVITIPQCNMLCIYQLYRLAGVYCCPIYFISADRFTEELCEQANCLMNNDANSKKIYIASVLITGETIKEAHLQVDNEMSYFCFFYHGPENKAIQAFFVWANNVRWINNHFKETKIPSLSKVGKTPFVASGGKIYYMEKHYRKIDEVFELAMDETYALLQEMNGISTHIVSMRHFDIENRHDFFHVDTKSLIYKSQIQSQTNPEYKKVCWDNMLCEFYYSLTGRTTQTHETIISNLNKRILYIENSARKIEFYSNRNQFPEGENKEQLIVYLSSFHNTLIANEIMDQFGDSLRNRIISLPPLLRERNATSLLISPLVIEGLKKTIDNIKTKNSKVIITMFSAINTSTRIRKELKHILFVLGADEVHTLTVLDRQRFTFGTYSNNSHRAFIRLDLPELGSSRACLLCEGLRELNLFRNINISSLIRNRLQSILNTWRSIKPSDNCYDTGMQMRKIQLPVELVMKVNEMCSQYGIVSITLETDFALAMFAVESIIISLDYDFYLSCILCNDIDDDSKMLLLAVLLLHFSNIETTISMQMDLCIKLYSIMKKQKRSSVYTSLSFIALAAQNKLIKKTLYSELQKADFLKYSKLTHMDFYVLNLYLYSEFREKSNPEYSLSCYLLNDYESTPYLIYCIALYTNYKSNHRHSDILIRLLQKGKNFTQRSYKEILGAIELLLVKYSELPISAYYDASALNKWRINCIEILNVYNIIIKDIIEKHEFTTIPPKRLLDINKDFIESAMIINEALIANNSGIIEPDVIEPPLPIKRRLQKMAEEVLIEYGSEIESIHIVEPVYCDDQPENIRWFYFYNDIIVEIKYLMGDFRHANKKKIDNVFERSDYLNKYTGIVVVDFKNTEPNAAFFEILFYNCVPEGIECDEIMSIKDSKTGRPTMLDFEILNKRIGKTENPLIEISEKGSSSIVGLQQERILKATLMIPYIDKKSINILEDD